VKTSLVGEGGLEPPTSCSQSRCATYCATPRRSWTTRQKLTGPPVAPAHDAGY
jgi:hypothetical protein